ncbi:hypothetical protein RSJ42_07615 [Methanosarcina hadiensis]
MEYTNLTYVFLLGQKGLSAGKKYARPENERESLELQRLSYNS